MPSKSVKQHRLMAMCANDKGRAKAKGACPPKETARKYLHADRGRHFGKGKR